MASLLDRLGRYFKTDLRYLAKGSFWALAGQIIVTLSAFAFSLVAARYIPQDVYGDYKYVLAAVSLLSTFSISGFSQSVFQSTAAGHEGSLRTGFRANLRWSAAIFALAIAIGGYYLFKGEQWLGLGILLGGCVTPFWNSANLYAAYLNGKKDWRRAAFYADVVDTLLPYGALIAVAIFYPHPLALVAAYFLSNLIAVAYAYWRTLRIYRPQEGADDPGMLTYAKQLSLINVLGGIMGTIDQVLVFHYVGAAELAIYTFATGLVDQTKGPLKSLDVMMQARFAPQKEGSIASGIHNKMFWLLMAAVAAIVVYIPLAPYIYKILFPLYVSAVPYSQIYALSLLAIAFWPYGSYFAAKKRVREYYAIISLTTLLWIIILFLGVFFGSLLGLVVARVVVKIGGGFMGFILYLTRVKD